jgi:hypoxanthine phosphoribosyltransferase
MLSKIDKVLISEDQIRQRIAELGKQITQDYADKNPVIVGVLKGVVIFYADMVRQINTHCEMAFMTLRSYSGTDSTGTLQVLQDLTADIEGRHVLILEDIFDTGNSLDYTYRYLQLKKPASIKICTLLDKPSRRKPGITLQADYVGFTVDNYFVVGYGLDFDEKFRNLPFIGVLKAEEYENKE